jgi:HD-GYP domain-containing protein (c-di-GMP phosphodiesterase class II)
MDGSGYPNKLTSPDILIEAKILRVADTVEAITSNRPHRPAKPLNIALQEIREKANKYYDPYIVEACCEIKQSS